MIDKIFEIKDGNGRIIYLSRERWKHIVIRHPELSNSLDNIKQTIILSYLVVQDKYDPRLYYYHIFLKRIKEYLIVSVKYLNGEGFIITAFYSKYKKK